MAVSFQCMTKFTTNKNKKINKLKKKKEYWSGSAFPPPGNFPDPWIKSACPTSPTMASRCVLYH